MCVSDFVQNILLTKGEVSEKRVKTLEELSEKSLKLRSLLNTYVWLSVLGRFSGRTIALVWGSHRRAWLLCVASATFSISKCPSKFSKTTFRQVSAVTFNPSE